MPLGMEIGLGPGDFVFDGDPAPPRKKGTAPTQFCPLWPNSCMDQDATWYWDKSRLRRRCVRWGCSSPLKGAKHPVFCPCLLWPNGWVDQDATWYGGKPRPWRLCVRRIASSSVEGAQQPPLFWPMSIVATVAHLSYCWALVCVSNAWLFAFC